MSQENVETLRTAYKRINAGDVDGFLDLCAEDLEFHDVSELPGSGVFIGHEAFRGWYAQLVEAFEALRFEAEEVVAAPGDHVVLVNHATGRGRASGAAVETRFTTVSTLREGKLVRHVGYIDHAEALKAAGL